MSRSLRSACGLTLVALLCALVLAGCLGGVAAGPPTREVAATPAALRPTPTALPTATPRPVQPRTLRLVAAAEQQPFAAAIAAVLAAHVPGLKVTLSTGEGAEALRQLDGGRADLALVYDDLAMRAAKKEAPFTDRAIQVAALAAVYRQLVQVIVGADTDIQAARGLVGKRVSVPPAGTHAADLTNQVLRGGGFVAGEFAVVAALDEGQAAAALRDGRVDAILTAGPAPLAAVKQAAEQRPVRLVPIDGGWRDLSRERYPYLVDATVPPGAYRGQEAPVATVGVAVLLAARRDLPEALAYDLARGLVEGKDDVAARYPGGVPLVPQEFTRAVNTPFHPAAVQYYDEQGLVK